MKKAIAIIIGVITVIGIAAVTLVGTGTIDVKRIQEAIHDKNT